MYVQCTCGMLRVFLYACTVHVSSFFLGKVTALGVLCCFSLFVCLTLLASFFHLSFINMHVSCNWLQATISSYSIGVYGDVIRVKILYNKRDSALIQFKEPQQIHTCEQHSSDVHVHACVQCIIYTHEKPRQK